MSEIQLPDKKEIKVDDVKITQKDSDVPPEVDVIVAKLKNMYHGKVTTVRLVSILTQGMLLMRSYKKFSGTVKKEVLLKAMHKFIDTQELSESDKTDYHDFIDVMAPGCIDTVFWVSQQKFNFNPTNCC